MSENSPPKGPTPQQKQERKAQQAQDGAKALKEYRERETATRERTAKLREQRLAREATQLQEAETKKPAPKKKDSE